MRPVPAKIDTETYFDANTFFSARRTDGTGPDGRAIRCVVETTHGTQVESNWTPKRVMVAVEAALNEREGL